MTAPITLDPPHAVGQAHPVDERFTVDQTLRHGVRALAAHSDSPRLDAALLLAQVLGLKRSGLITHGDETLTAEARCSYEALLERRRDGTPVAYLTGTREFWSLPFCVTPAVLVPRPETETLVAAALELLPTDRPRCVLDLGTGSGAIALAIASERPRCQVTAVDVSQHALDVARRNAAALKIERIRWCHGSWFEALQEAPATRFDVIVSNPPYVADGDPALAALRAEPLQALTCGPTGLEALQAIIGGAAGHLEAGGWLLLEHGNSQAPAVATLLAMRGFIRIHTLTDAAGLPRVTIGSLQPQEKECS